MSELSLVVFDLAGTTIEDHAVVAGALVTALAAVGISVSPQDANTVMGLPKPVAIARLIERAADRPEPLGSPRVVRANQAFERAITRHYGAPGAIVPIAGAEDLFEALHAEGVLVAIDSGFSSAVVDVILERLAWRSRGLVDVTVASDEVSRGRPAPDMIYEAMRRSRITDPRAVAKVGDTPADLKEGAAAGCPWIVGVTYGTHTRTQLIDYPHTALIDHLRDLPWALGLGKRSPIGDQRSARPTFSS